MNTIKKKFIAFIQHLCDESILSEVSVDYNQNLVSLVSDIKNELLKVYPDTSVRIPVKSIHYANNFDNGGLKEVAFMLEEISQLLYFNGYLDEEKITSFFNSKVTEDDFDFSPVNLVLLTIDGLSMAKK
ncbi:hypothetical protein HCQ94_05995 [Actinomyces sp. zg-332]|uniref:hypothetical protein n=1 Tax=Actinomyces sp. zg-332 TaxID=2708340 RepID=UPI00141F2E47|nr:hypothetical protein [Actinomyces sp. zg-332]QPK94109.1 hypothetical protein HCQ94_05995 [Actinomyces sp. zg-332]